MKTNPTSHVESNLKVEEVQENQLTISDSERKILSDFLGYDIGLSIDFNRLMLCVEKIEALSVKGFVDISIEDNSEVEWQFSVEIYNGQCLINRDVLPQYYGTESDFLGLYDCRKTSKIESVYQAVYQFVVWFKENSNKLQTDKNE